MLTDLGKYLRKLRIDNGELLKDMADKLEISCSYLSSIETGKKKLTEQIKKKLIYTYKLDTKVFKEE